MAPAPCGCRALEDAKGTPSEAQRVKAARGYQRAWMCPRAGRDLHGVPKAKPRLSVLPKACEAAHRAVSRLVKAEVPEGCPCAGLYAEDATRVARASWLAENGMGSQLHAMSHALVCAVEQLHVGRSDREALEFEEAKSEAKRKAGSK